MIRVTDQMVTAALDAFLSPDAPYSTTPQRSRMKAALAAALAQFADANAAAPDMLAAVEEIERLQEAKRRALSIADERAKENVALRAELDRLSFFTKG